MTSRRLLVRSLEVALVTVAVLLVLGQVLGQPVLLGYVESGSMAPALERGDGYIAVPTALAGSIEVGDVVTYRAQRLDGGGLTTHRVVGQDGDGYRTRGDANVFTDQESEASEPPVQRPQIVAVAVSVGGEVVAVPYLGMAVEAVQAVMADLQAALVTVVGRAVVGQSGLPSVLAVAAVLLYVASVISDRRRDPASESVRPLGATVAAMPPMRVLSLLAVLVVVAATVGMVLPGGVQTIDIVSTENDAPGARLIQHGTTESTTYVVLNGGLLPVVAYVEPVSDGVAVSPRELVISGGGRAEPTLTLTAPEEIGHYRYFVVEHRYLALLPLPVVRRLFALHPWAPILAIDALLFGGILLLGRLALVRRPVRGRQHVRLVLGRLR